MKVTELNREQLLQLKQKYMCEKGNPSYGDLANADLIVSDAWIEYYYGGTEFVEEDFV